MVSDNKKKRSDRRTSSFTIWFTPQEEKRIKSYAKGEILPLATLLRKVIIEKINKEENKLK